MLSLRNPVNVGMEIQQRFYTRPAEPANPHGKRSARGNHPDRLRWSSRPETWETEIVQPIAGTYRPLWSTNVFAGERMIGAALY